MRSTWSFNSLMLLFSGLGRFVYCLLRTEVHDCLDTLLEGEAKVHVSTKRADLTVPARRDDSRTRVKVRKSYAMDGEMWQAAFKWGAHSWRRSGASVTLFCIQHLVVTAVIHYRWSLHFAILNIPIWVIQNGDREAYPTPVSFIGFAVRHLWVRFCCRFI